jgi:hypothetical protein
MVTIVKSEAWTKELYSDINVILNEAISQFNIDSANIINIQVVKDESGLSRFWIYIKS